MGYLADIAASVRAYHATTEGQVVAARRRQHLHTAATVVAEAGVDAGALSELVARAEQALPTDAAMLLDTWPEVVEAYSGDRLVVTVRDQEL